MSEKPNLIVNIKATSIELTDAIRDYVEKKLHSLGKLLGFYGREGQDVFFDVEVGKTTLHHKSGDIFRAEINFNAGSTNYRSVSNQGDLYAAIDQAKDGMQRELRRNKNKNVEYIKRQGRKIKDILRGFYWPKKGR